MELNIAAAFVSTNTKRLWYFLFAYFWDKQLLLWSVRFHWFSWILLVKLAWKGIVLAMLRRFRVGVLSQKYAFSWNNTASLQNYWFSIDALLLKGSIFFINLRSIRWEIRVVITSSWRALWMRRLRTRLVCSLRISGRRRVSNRQALIILPFQFKL